MDTEKNIYGLSEGVFKACQFLGLKFPSEAIDKENLVPSDYFGDDFEFDAATKKKLCSARKWSIQKLNEQYKLFAAKFATQKPLKKTKTDLNVYVCDYVLFASVQNGASANDYFDFEFYKQFFNTRNEFLTQKHRNRIRAICNIRYYMKLTSNKSKTNELFADFLHREWLNTTNCEFEAFKSFVAKHPRFFSKPVGGTGGQGTNIITVAPTDNLEKLFASLKAKESLLEEVVTQHEALAAFCPDTVNTIRVYTLLDIHNVAHILMTIGRFGRIGNVVDNFLISPNIRSFKASL